MGELTNEFYTEEEIEIKKIVSKIEKSYAKDEPATIGSPRKIKCILAALSDVIRYRQLGAYDKVRRDLEELEKYRSWAQKEFGEVIVSDVDHACCVCGKPTRFIEICYEAPFCSRKCIREMDKLLIKTEEKAGVLL